MGSGLLPFLPHVFSILFGIPFVSSYVDFKTSKKMTSIQDKILNSYMDKIFYLFFLSLFVYLLINLFVYLFPSFSLIHTTQ
jgi:hypothetical protein